MGRFIGIRHRTKVTAEEEARPTEVVILSEDGEVSAEYQLEDEQAELNFLRGQFPIGFREPTEGEELSETAAYHLKIRAGKASETIPQNLLRLDGTKQYRILGIADKFAGLQAGDTVAMTLGGSGDYFAYALARRGEEIGAKVVRLPAYQLKAERGEGTKDNDAALLATLAVKKPLLFYDLRARDRELIQLRELFRNRIDAMKARLGCEQRLRQRFIGNIFCSPEGYFPEGAIEKIFDEKKANDHVLKALVEEEAARERELRRSVEASGVWQHVFAEVEGMGWAIASRIIAAVEDIRRFVSDPIDPTDEIRLSYDREAKLRRNALTQDELAELKAQGGGAQAVAMITKLIEEKRASEAPGVNEIITHLEAALREHNLRTALRAQGQKPKRRTAGIARFKAFCGVHILEDGSFARKRRGQVANWHPDARQALYLFAEQMNRRPESVWGKRLREIKAELRRRHPEPVQIEKPGSGGKVSKVSRYSNGHIHKMALWRAMTEFAEWLYGAWTEYERTADAKDRTSAPVTKREAA